MTKTDPFTISDLRFALGRDSLEMRIIRVQERDGLNAGDPGQLLSKDGVGASQTGRGFHRQEDVGQRAFLAKKTM